MMFQLLIFFLFVQKINAIIDGDLAVKFFKTKFLKLGTVFTCSSRKDNIQLTKLLMENGIRVSTFYLEKQLPVSTILYRDYYHLGVVVDGNCKNLQELLIQCGNSNLFDDTRHWLIATNSKEIVVDYFMNVNLNVNAEIHLAVKRKIYWKIYDLYNQGYKHGGKLHVEEIGFYDNDHGYNAYLKGSKYFIRRNMTGVSFKSAVVIPNWNTLNESLEDYLASEKNREKNTLNRFGNVVLNHCKDFFNFTLHVRVTNSWGYVQANGIFDGLVRLLEIREVDFGNSPLIFKLDRLPVVGYSYGTWILKSVFIYVRPKSTQRSYEIFLRPLDNTVWGLIILVIIIFLFLLRSAFKIEHRILTNFYHIIEASWSYSLLFIIAAFCQQGSSSNPNSLFGRSLAILLFMFSVVIYQFYSASIVSYLLLEPPRTIRTLKDLLDSSLRAGVDDFLIDRSYFAQTTDPVAIELFHKKVLAKGNGTGFYKDTDGLAMVQKGGFAFHIETSSAYPIIEKTFTNEMICELQEVQMYKTQPMHHSLQKGSPFREMLTFCLVKMVENGLLDHLRIFWDARKPTCLKSAKKLYISVGIQEFSCAIVVLVIGIALSLIILMFEIFEKKIKENHKSGKKSEPIKPFVL